MTSFDPEILRREFPALALEQDGRPVVFLDGPGGTQVPQRVIAAVGEYLPAVQRQSPRGLRDEHPQRRDRRRCALVRGRLPRRDLPGRGHVRPEHDVADVRPVALDRARAPARRRGGDLAPGPRGQPRARGSPPRPTPARPSARSTSTRTPARWILASLDAVLNGAHAPGRRRLRVQRGRDAEPGGRDRPAGARGGRLDVRGRGPLRAPRTASTSWPSETDFLACSAYKFFGPHVGILYGRAELLDSLPAYKVRPAVERWETGTQNHEGIAGVGCRAGVSGRDRGEVWRTGTGRDDGASGSPPRWRRSRTTSAA